MKPLRQVHRSRPEEQAPVESPGQPWYEVAFDGDYLARYAERSDAAAAREAPFLVRALGAPRGTWILDVCCGGGRHCRGLAAAGYRVVGVDLSPELLRCGGRHGPALCLARGDARSMPLRSGVFAGAVNLFTSFGYFATEAEDLQALNEVARVLTPDGVFVLDFFNLRPTVEALVAHSEKRVGDLHVREWRRYDGARRRLEKTVRVEDTTGARPARQFTESVRAYSPQELSVLLRQAGLQETARFGDLHGSAFHVQRSPRCVCVARKSAR
jgi:SAM-dependent methyltransferase